MGFFTSLRTKGRLTGWASLAQEASASVALDGETHAVTQFKDRRESPGFGCPWCGASLEDATEKELIYGVLNCCGARLEGQTAARLLRGRQLCADS